MTLTLSSTAIDVLKFLTTNLTKEFTILKIAENTGKTTRLTYAVVSRLAKEKIITIEKQANLKLSRINLKMPQIISYIESIRWHEFAKKHREINLIISDIIKKSSLPYFTLSIFGSYAKNTITKTSDLDILIIIPDKKLEDSIEAAVKSAKSLSKITLHDIIITHLEFLDMLKEKKINVAKEALEARYIPYGAEPFYTMVGQTA